MDVADINGAGKLYQKEENDDTGRGLNPVRKGKIGVKSLVVEYGEYSAEYSPTPSLKLLSRFSGVKIQIGCSCVRRLFGLLVGW